MIYRTTIFIAFLFFISCSQKKQFPDFVSEKVELENVSLNTQLPILTSSKINTPKILGLDKLSTFQGQFLKKDLAFNLDEFKSAWSKIQKENNFKNANSVELKKWFGLSGLLMELTGEAAFAEELEKIVFSGIGQTIEENKKIVAPYIFTKNTDHIFINLFVPSTIIFNHTLKGKVKVEMECNYPRSGKMDIKFNMTENRFIELNVRIPGWANGATVTVRNVKYFAPPGGYCKISRKWKEGDSAEINFPMENVPAYLKIN